MRIHHLLGMAALGALLAAPANAQSVKKVGSNIHKTLQKAGNDVKEAGGEVGSATHKTLKKAGRDVKAEVKRETGAKPIGGDVGKAARQVSNTGKKTGRHAKKELKHAGADTHKELTEAGKGAKETVKKPE